MIDLDEILNDPLLEIDEKQMELFDLPEDMRNIMAERKQPEHYAERKPCENFGDYLPLFAKVKAELKEGKRTLIRTGKSSNFEAGNFYYIDGIMVYLESVGKATKASNGMKYARTRCIYENGVEQDLLLETLRKNVTTSGYAITQPEEQSNREFFSNADISDDDKVTGYIYVLRSLSDVKEIAETKNLYKIGFTTTTVEERIANATHEPTYLMAPVEIVASYKVVNMNSHMFESLVHQVLKAVNFHVEVKDDNGIVHTPKEWYVVPLTVIDTIVSRILDRSILNYEYNAQMQCLELKNGSACGQNDTLSRLSIT